MTIQEFLAGTCKTLTEPVPSGTAKTPKDLYDNCITVPYPSGSHKDAANVTQAITDWHKLLVWYAKQPGAVLLSRLYESQKTNGVDDNRRNTLTVSQNYNYAFCSNYFARVIMTMALNGFCPSKQDFWNWLVVNKNVRLGYFKTTAVEKRIAAYNTNHYNSKFYTPGWYLAHIIPVNDKPYNGCANIDIKKDIFKLGTESDWAYDSTEGKIIRKNGDKLTPNQKKVAIAHFLRCLDPINYFLVPSPRKNVIYNKKNSDDGTPLGENKFVVEYMLIKAYERFGCTFIDFLNNALADTDIKTLCSNKSTIASSKIDAKYAVGIKGNTSNKYTHATMLEVAAYYLRHNVGLDKANEVVLNIHGGHGNTACEIVHSLGITDTSRKSPYKGLLLNSNIDDEITKATGTFKQTLIDMKVLGL